MKSSTTTTPAVEVKLLAQIGDDEPIEIGVLTVEKLSDLTDFTAALNTLNGGDTP